MLPMTEFPVTIYTPGSALRRPARMLRDMLHDLAASREIALRLAIRDIRAQYRQAVLGVLWALALPLANAATWVFLSRSGIVSVGETGLPYGMYVLAGTMCWAIFTESISAPLQQTDAARGMLAKLNFPREALILSGIYQTVFNAVMKVAVLLGALVVFHVQLGWGLLLFPLGLLSLVLVGTVVGLLVTPVGMLYTDVGRAVRLLMQVLMYCTPIVFPLPQSGLPATLLAINPMTPLIVTTRAWLTGLGASNMGYFVAINAIAVVLLLVVWAVYRLAMPILIERMSS